MSQLSSCVVGVWRYGKLPSQPCWCVVLGVVCMTVHLQMQRSQCVVVHRCLQCAAAASPQCQSHCCACGAVCLCGACRFAMYNVVGALVWTAIFLGAGFFFGNMPGETAVCLPWLSLAANTLPLHPYLLMPTTVTACLAARLAWCGSVLLTHCHGVCLYTPCALPCSGAAQLHAGGAGHRCCVSGACGA